MDARPTLFTLARVLDEEGLEAIWRTSSRARGRRDGPGTGRCWRFWRRRWMRKRRARMTRREALQRESDRALRDRIRRLLQKPPEERTHFLRKRIGFQASCL